VTNPASIGNAPAFSVIAYGLLLLAAAKVFGVNGQPDLLPPPKWRKTSKARPSTQDLINHLRAEIWAQGLGIDHFSGFVNTGPDRSKPEKSLPDLVSAVLYATG
jgi:hypothetical protein